MRVTKSSTIKFWGGRVSWSSANLIAIDKIGDGPYYNVHLMTPSGFWKVQDLTDGNPTLPDRHVGNPAWHPNGRHLVLQCQKPGTPNSYWANPGVGINNDLWLLDTRTAQAFPLTDIDPGLGVLHPHVSPDGKRLCWAETLEQGGDAGIWSVKVADLVLGKRPQLANVRTYQPGTNPQVYETHGFTPDGSRVLFSGNPDDQPTNGGDIYVLDLASGQATNLTNAPDEWDEHAQLRPQGDWIVWMSSRGIESDRVGAKTDYWAMRPNGTDRHRLTFFNEPGHPQCIDSGVMAGDCAWSPDGSTLLCYLLQIVALGTARLVALKVAA